MESGGAPPAKHAEATGQWNPVFVVSIATCNLQPATPLVDMTTALVTGATGFIGYHVARLLTRKGLQVRALVRNSSDIRPLADLDIELVCGDLRDHGAVRNAVRGSDQVYHVAADYRLWVPDPESMYETNVQGTINVMEAALAQRRPEGRLYEHGRCISHVEGRYADERTVRGTS